MYARNNCLSLDESSDGRAFDQSSIGSRVGIRSNPGSSNLITGLDTPSHQPRTITSADPRVPNTPPEAGFLPLPDSPNDLLRLAQTTVGQWYLPDINPTEVRKRLEQQPAGRFIIRRSNREHNHYHLAFTTGNGEVRRVTLELTPAGYTVKGLSQGRYYPTIAHLVADHCSQVSILPCLLRLPGYKSVSKHAGCFSSPSVSSSSTANFNWFMRNRLSSQMNGIGGPLTEYQTFTPFPQVWTRRMVEPRGITDTWTDQIPVPPVPPHRTSNANERFRNQFQRPAYSLLPQGAACQLFYLGGFEVLFRPGPQAVQLCTDHLFGPERNAVQLTRVNFRVNEMGITVTDLDRKLFIQRQYPIACVLYMGLDPRGRRWKSLELYNEGMVESRIFGFVAANQTNPSGSSQCHLFCEYDLSEPANVICDFTNRYLNLLEV
ncbi:hypothetical protein D915_005263 [Fasciola hepatica]|uniref:SH2 domain-containing protein n=1 Tax=Fasciola hepatica TaxID=6192 RepID=A0A4E0RTK3_FASHE|nr:hypothetical protein D915_005263 [Fasciola hepatica]